MELVDKKKKTLALLRGGTCDQCKNFLREVRLSKIESRYRELEKFVKAPNTDDYSEIVELVPPHCAMRTTMEGQVCQRSETDSMHSCKSFWGRGPRAW